MSRDFLSEAWDRLEWIREEYGEDDIDYQTFYPLVKCLSEVKELSAKSTRTRVKSEFLPGTFRRASAWLSQTWARVTKS